MKKLSYLLLSISLLSGIGLITYGVLRDIQFVRGCEGHLKRSADANTIELAKIELKTAVDYLESEELTQGSSHVFYEMPNCDIGFWYTNLKASLDELEAMPSDVDRLTASNQLIKLRETLLDHGEKRARVTLPPDIHVFPNQTVYRILGLGTFGALTLSSIMLAAAHESCKKPKASQAGSSPSEAASV